MAKVLLEQVFVVLFETKLIENVLLKLCDASE